MTTHQKDLHVLMVEHEQDEIDLVKPLLESKGFEVTVATTAQEALAKLNTDGSSTDVALIDLGLLNEEGKQDVQVGLKLVKAIREREKKSQSDHRVVIVIWTKYGHSYEQDCLDAGANALVTKMSSSTTLAEVIRRCWSGAADKRDDGGQTQ